MPWVSVQKLKLNFTLNYFFTEMLHIQKSLPDRSAFLYALFIQPQRKDLLANAAIWPNS